MSREFIIQATYYNEVKVQRGVYCPKNWDMIPNSIGYLSIQEVIKRFKKAVGTKNYRDLTIQVCRSGSCSKKYPYEVKDFKIKTMNMIDYKAVEQFLEGK